MTIDIETKLLKIFEKKFNLKNKKNKIQKLSASNFKKWDSLEHLKIIMETNPVILNAIRDSLQTHLRNYIVNREYQYILPDNDDLSSAILLDVITRFGSPGNDNFHKHMKEHRKSQIKKIGKLLMLT